MAFSRMDTCLTRDVSVQDADVFDRVVSSKISGGIFMEIYSNLSGNLLKNFCHFMLQSSVLQSEARS